MSDSNNITKLQYTELALRESSLVIRGLELLKPKKSILIFDSSHSTVENIISAISNLNINIFTAHDIQKALNIIENETIHILSTEYPNDNPNEFNFINSVKTNYPNIKIIVFTSKADISIETLYMFLNLNTISKLIHKTSGLTEYKNEVLRIINRESLKRNSNNTLLVVDDEMGLLWALEKHVLLNMHDLNVITKTNPFEVLDMIMRDNNNIDIIDTDIIMVGMNGVELADSIRKYNQTIKIMLHSSYSYPKNFVKLLYNGALDYYLEAPFEKEEYLKAIRQLMTI